MRIEYHPSLETDLVEIRDYYNEQSPRLGDAFVEEFERQILRIASMPERWMVVQNDMRRALMRRFPYIILFRLLDTETIRILVVKHERRHPAYGIERY